MPPRFDLQSHSTQSDGELATGADKAALQQQGQLLNTMLAPFVGVPAPGVTAGGAMNFAPDRQTELPPEVARAYNKVATKAPPKPAATSKDPDHVTACPFVLPQTPVPERLGTRQEPAGEPAA